MKAQNIEDLYMLSPMQEGMLYHSLHDGGPDLYLRQFSCELQGRLNPEAFQSAWSMALERHPVLRTSFHWEGLEKPLQVVHRQVSFSVEECDWRGKSPDESRKLLTRLLSSQRTSRFNLTEPPLMRVTLVRLEEELYRLIWNYQHLIMDGWSRSLLIGEVLKLYDSISSGREAGLDPARPYREYIAWLRRQDLTRAEAFWRNALKGIVSATPLGKSTGDHTAPGTDADYDIQRSQIPPFVATALQSLGKQNRLTMNTIVQGAWALLLSHNSGLQNVVFGAVVSGRPPDLPGVETTIGLFINTLPVRITVTPQAPLIAWLREIQATQMEMRHYEYSPLVQVQGWSEVPRGKPLFESILNFGNHPINRMYGSDAGSIEVRGIEFFERNHYPLVLQAQAHSGLSLSIPYDRRRFDKTDVSGLMRRLEKLLEAIAFQPDATSGRLIEGLDQEQRQTVELRRDQFKATRSASLKNLRLKQSLS